MTPEQEAAMRSLLGQHWTAEGQTREQLQRDAVAAAKEALRRREQNSTDGGVVIAFLNRDLLLTYDEIEELTDIPRPTAQRWAVPPKRARGN